MTNKERSAYRKILNDCQNEFVNIYRYSDFSLTAARRLSIQIQHVLDMNRVRKEDWVDNYYNRESVKDALMGKDSANTDDAIRDLRKAEARIEELSKAFCSVISQTCLEDTKKALIRIRKISNDVLKGYHPL